MANDLNKLFLIGRLTRDCGSDPNGRDFGYTQQGLCRAVISIAVNRSKKQQDGTYADEVSYFDINIWGKTAENLRQYLLKGTQVMVEAVIKQDRWQDKQTGKNCSKIAIHAENIQLLGGKRDSNNSAPSPETVYPTAQAAQSAYAQQYQQQNPQNTGSAPRQFAQQQNYQNGGNQQNGGGFPEDIPWDDNIPF